MQILVAAVDDDLLAAEVRVPERGRGVDHRAGLEVLHRAQVDKGLELRHRKAEEGRVARADQQAVVAVVVAAGLEGHQDELLAGEPAEGVAPQLVKFVAVDVLEARLVCRLVVCDAHAVGVAAAHVVLGVIHGRAVLAADDLGLLDALAVYVVEHLYLVGVFVAEYEFKELILARGDDYAGAVVDDLTQSLREREAFKQYVQWACLAFCTQAYTYILKYSFALSRRKRSAGTIIPTLRRGKTRAGCTIFAFEIHNMRQIDLSFIRIFPRFYAKADLRRIWPEKRAAELKIPRPCGNPLTQI